MKTVSTSLLSVAILSGLSGAAVAANTPYSLSANVAMTSDYVWRGVSQTSENPAIQGGFDFGHESGFYVGTWGSNVSGYGAANMEIDLYTGFGNELPNGLSYDAGYNYYMYPDNNADLDFGEFYLKLGFNIASFEYYYSPDMGDLSTHYYNLGVSYELPQGFSLGGSIGYYDIEDAPEGVVDWKLFVGTSVGGFDLELAYTDTDIDNAPDIAEGRAVFTVSKSF
jgi:uncharacterized protein (TIGR02001 family)